MHFMSCYHFELQLSTECLRLIGITLMLQKSTNSLSLEFHMHMIVILGCNIHCTKESTWLRVFVAWFFICQIQVHLIYNFHSTDFVVFTCLLYHWTISDSDVHKASCVWFLVSWTIIFLNLKVQLLLPLCIV